MTENSFLLNDATLPLEQCIDDLVGRLTLAEKIAQMMYEALGRWFTDGRH